MNKRFLKEKYQDHKNTLKHVFPTEINIYTYHEKMEVQAV